MPAWCTYLHNCHHRRVLATLAQGWLQSAVLPLPVKLATARQPHAQGCAIGMSNLEALLFPGAGCTQPRTRLRPGAGLRSMQQTTRLTLRRGAPSSTRRPGAARLPATSRACPSATGCTPSGALLQHPYEERHHLSGSTSRTIADSSFHAEAPIVCSVCVSTVAVFAHITTMPVHGSAPCREGRSRGVSAF